ncbi:MAG: PilN domain-containing protein [Candidatus Saccharimonadales bacterium]
MINLLPLETKHQIRAARTNRVLRRYCVLLVLTGLLLGSVFAGGFWVAAEEKALAESLKASSQQSAQEYAQTRKAAEDFAKDLATAKTILASNVSFSKVVLDIAGVVPSGVILNNLTLGGSAKPDAPIDISGRAKSYDNAINLKNSLEESPIFENVSIVNITTNTAEQTPGTKVDPVTQEYPFTLSLKVQFSKKPGGSQ